MTVSVLTSAAREGCRLAVVTAPDVPAVTARVTDVCNSAGVTPTSITVTRARCKRSDTTCDCYCGDEFSNRSPEKFWERLVERSRCALRP